MARRKILAALVFSFLAAQLAFADEPFLPNSVLSLDDCIAVALRHNPDLIAAEKNLKAADSHASAATAGYWPQVGLEADYIRGNFVATTGPVQSLLTSVFTTYITRFNSSFLLEDFGERHAEVGKANAQIAQAQALYHDTRSQVIFNIAQTYFSVLEAQALNQVAQDHMAAAQKHLQLAQSFVQVGEKPKLEQLKAETDFAGARYDHLKAAQDLENAATRLNEMMGISNPPAYTLQENGPVPIFSPSLAEAKIAAFNSNPELLSAQAKVREQHAAVNQLKATRWPVLAANGAYGWLDSVFPPKTQSWALGMTLNWPLFDGNRLTHQINETVARQEENEAQEERLRLAINTEVEENYRSLTEAQEQLDVAQEEVTSADEAYHLAETRYKVGLTSLLELADAETNRSRAKAHEISAITQLRIAQAALKRSMGVEAP